MTLTRRVPILFSVISTWVSCILIVLSGNMARRAYPAMLNSWPAEFSLPFRIALRLSGATLPYVLGQAIPLILAVFVTVMLVLLKIKAPGERVNLMVQTGYQFFLIAYLGLLMIGLLSEFCLVLR